MLSYWQMTGVNIRAAYKWIYFVKFFPQENALEWKRQVGSYYAAARNRNYVKDFYTSSGVSTGVEGKAQTVKWRN